MKRFYELIAVLAVVRTAFMLFDAYGHYGITWRYDACWIPTRIVDPDADGLPFDTLHAVGRDLERPGWIVLYLVGFVVIGMFVNLWRGEVRRARRERIVGTFRQNSQAISQMAVSDHERARLRELNIEWLEDQLGPRFMKQVNGFRKKRS